MSSWPSTQLLTLLIFTSGCNAPIGREDGGVDADLRDADADDLHDADELGDADELRDADSIGDADDLHDADELRDADGPVVCHDDGADCLSDQDCCGVCDLRQGRCHSPSWLTCTEPAHGLEPAPTPGADPPGQLRYLLDQGYQGDIYDGHSHLFAVPETYSIPVVGGFDELRFAVRPISIAEHYDLHMFYLGADFGVRGFLNMALGNLGGLGDSSSSYEWRGASYAMEYRIAEADGNYSNDNITAFAGNVLAPSVLYTQLASFDEETDRYHSFAFAPPDWADIRQGVIDGSILTIGDVKARLRAQFEKLRDIGFDGLKFVSEWATSEANGKWGIARHLVLLESVTSEDDPWSPGGEMFSGEGGIFDTAAELGLAITIHTEDNGVYTEAFWSEGGIYDRALTNYPGLKLNIAHGFVFANIHGHSDHDEHTDPETAQRCDQIVEMVMELLERHDGQQGRSKLTFDMVGSQIQWWVDHNEAYHQGRATTHDYRSLLIEHSDHFMLGLDPLNRAVSVYQTEGCGGRAPNFLESLYLTQRIRLEGPYRQENPNLRYLDLVDEGDTLQNIYRDTLFELVAAEPSQAGPAGRDSGGVRRIDCQLAAEYTRQIRASVRSDLRGLTPDEDPLIESLEETLNQITDLCQP